MTQKQLFAAVRDLGMSIKKDEAGDYVVNHPRGSEGTAYFTTDRDDALGTAKLMKEGATNA